MAQPVFKNWFTAQGRRNRLSYFWASIVVFILACLLFIIGAGVGFLLFANEIIAAVFLNWPVFRGVLDSPVCATDGDLCEAALLEAGMAIWPQIKPLAAKFSVVLMLFYLPIFFAAVFIDAQRLRDLNIRGRWALLLFLDIPFSCAFFFVPVTALGIMNSAYNLLFIVYILLWLVMVVAPGHEGKNKFGADPLRRAPAKRRAKKRKTKRR